MSIAVTPDRLRQSAATLRAGGSTIGSELARLLGDVRDLQGTWVGRAAGSFEAYYQSANEGFRQVEDALEGIAAMLGTTADLYERQDADRVEVRRLMPAVRAQRITADPAALRRAVTELEHARAELSHARDDLHIVDDSLHLGGVMDHDGEADHKVHTFCRQWRQEFEKIGQQLTVFDVALQATADSYATSDAELAAAIARLLDC